MQVGSHLRPAYNYLNLMSTIILLLEGRESILGVNFRSSAGHAEQVALSLFGLFVKLLARNQKRMGG